MTFIFDEPCPGVGRVTLNRPARLNAINIRRTMGRYLRQLKTGEIKIDKGKIKEKGHLD